MLCACWNRICPAIFPKRPRFPGSGNVWPLKVTIHSLNVPMQQPPSYRYLVMFECSFSGTMCILYLDQYFLIGAFTKCIIFLFIKIFDEEFFVAIYRIKGTKNNLKNVLLSLRTKNRNHWCIRAVFWKSKCWFQMKIMK